jgi:K+-sensing histidine kinase KdpD
LGPAVTTAVALIAFSVDRYFVTMPNPAPLFVCIVALASSISGIVSGLVSAGIAVIFSALFFLNHRAAPGYDAHDLARMVLLALTAAGTALITGALRQKWIDAFAAEQVHYATSARLAAALDEVDIASCCSAPTPAPSSSTAPSATILRCPTTSPKASRPSSR